MRLASKFFAATTLVIMALVGVAAWSLLAVDHLVRAHREITDRSLPALQIEVALQEVVPRLLRLEARYLVLRDRAYGDLLKERTERAVADLGRLDALLASTAEMASSARRWLPSRPIRSTSARSARSSASAIRRAPWRSPKARRARPPRNSIAR